MSVIVEIHVPSHLHVYWCADRVAAFRTQPFLGHFAGLQQRGEEKVSR